MIDRITGELHFSWGQHILPQSPLPPQVLEECRPIAIQEGAIFMLGTWPSDHGPFFVGVAVNKDLRIQGVLLCHWIRAYRRRVVCDRARHAYHEAVILRDLAGQREFAWGSVDCRLDPVDNRSWLVVTYGPGPMVPLSSPEILNQLVARSRGRGVTSDEIQKAA